MIDVLKRITEYRMERQWTEYKLATVSELPQSTISSWYRKGMLPSLTSLEKICDGFQITLSQFFDENNYTAIVSAEEKQLLTHWQTLTPEKRKALWNLIKLF
ncbi:MAG: helix-turn-helix transcriptional regulator [Clostridiales bacterium]